MSARLLAKVRIVAIFLFCGFPVVATAQKEPIEVIEDNSFLIEEAYNQAPGVVQHIFQSVYSSGPRQRGWAFAFTQEWPIGGQDHQFSYTVPGWIEVSRTATRESRGTISFKSSSCFPSANRVIVEAHHNRSYESCFLGGTD